MCFVKDIEEVEDLRPQVAEKDGVEVWKIFYATVHENTLLSPYQKFYYQVGKTYKAEIKAIVGYAVSASIRIEAGLHSYNSKKIAGMEKEKFSYLHNLTGTYNTPIVIRKCLIPAEATYYTNKKGEVVSSKLIILEEDKGEEQDG